MRPRARPCHALMDGVATQHVPLRAEAPSVLDHRHTYKYKVVCEHNNRLGFMNTYQHTHTQNCTHIHTRTQNTHSHTHERIHTKDCEAASIPSVVIPSFHPHHHSHLTHHVCTHLPTSHTKTQPHNTNISVIPEKGSCTPSFVLLCVEDALTLAGC